MRPARFAVLVSLAGAAALATAQNAPAAAPAAAAERPATEFPYTPGLNPASMDRSADPCVDFYQYACGGWMKNNPIPADQARWSVYSKLAQDNQRFLWGILEDLSKRQDGRNANQQKIGDYFGACMDERAIEARGAAPLKPYFDQIATLRSSKDLPRVLARLHLALADQGLFFGFGSSQDFGDSTRVIAFASAGGLGLPDRDSYLKTDAKSKEIRARYVAHIANTFKLLGDAPDQARRQADRVMAMETELAKASLSRVDKRDPYKLFHKVDAKGLQALTPGFDWHAYLDELGQGKQTVFNVTEPAFFKALAKMWKSTDIEATRSYLRWQVARDLSPALASNFDQEHFDFFSKTLRGIQQQPPRWKRCVALVDRQLGEALGQEFVSRAFSPELKAKSLHMTRQVEEAMKKDIDSLDWMSPATKQRAQEKLAAIVNKIGYPDRWRDYGAYTVKPGDFAGNVERGNVFESRRQLAKIGKPLDRGEWSMTPPTVNAYFDPQMNDINFPAGVLQPPLFDPKMDDAPNYGNTGGTIGHELTHAFDDEGRQFDAKGNLKDWWTRKDAKEYEERAACIVDQYAQYTVVDDVKINSKLTLGEDIADLGGLILGWMAWKTEMAGMPQKAQPQGELRDGLSPEQRFFVGYAQWACENDRPENLRVKAMTDPHSPGRYRVNGLVVNMPQFQQAFQCKPGQPMVKEKRCRVW
ncbi:peptidase M13 [Massilia sp. WF1]|uniref:M13 family metallopeptidase n=1 Tax=unclassified Massilia TaxID=2609279 RepID=UPI000690AF27|nr:MULTISPECIES: M13 family metallopeptidase [unclassified Massilia]ALK95764.1 peptidase M13 [Massilia sp. WG5]KNZ68017.1 peptidase M13 [Massilia sp. WF1]